MKYNIALGIGSNLGDREQNINQSIKLLSEEIENIRVSKNYINSALLPFNAPLEWNKEFINTALIGQTSLNPQDLLKLCKQIEILLGREKIHPKWSPRVIDIDILLYEDLKIDDINLTIPHPLMVEREFVITPLKELLPNLKFEKYD